MLEKRSIYQRPCFKIWSKFSKLGISSGFIYVLTANLYQLNVEFIEENSSILRS